jgi:hypothetical protein
VTGESSARRCASVAAGRRCSNARPGCPTNPPGLFSTALSLTVVCSSMNHLFDMTVAPDQRIEAFEELRATTPENFALPFSVDTSRIPPERIGLTGRGARAGRAHPFGIQKVSRVCRSCERRCQVSRWCTGLPEPWLYSDTDFGEGWGRSPQPVLRAVVEVSTLGASATFQANRGHEWRDHGHRCGPSRRRWCPVSTGSTMMLRLGGSTNAVPLFEMTLEVRPPHTVATDRPISWRGVVASRLRI